MRPPPAKVFAEALVMVIVEVLGLTVSPVVVAVFHAVVPLPVMAQVALPMFKVRVLLLLEEKEPAVTLKFAALSVPAVNVTMLLATIGSLSVTVPPGALTVIPAIVFPLLVKVPVAAIVGSCAVNVPPVDKVMSP